MPFRWFKAGSGIHFRRHDQRTVRVVCPGMVRTANRSAVPLAIQQQSAAVSATIREGAHLSIRAANYDHRHAGEFDCEVVTLIWNPVGAADEVPDFHEYRLDFTSI